MLPSKLGANWFRKALGLEVVLVYLGWLANLAAPFFALKTAPVEGEGSVLAARALRLRVGLVAFLVAPLAAWAALAAATLGYLAGKHAEDVAVTVFHQSVTRAALGALAHAFIASGTMHWLAHLAVFRAAVAAWQALLCLPVQEAIVAVPARVSVQARAAVVNFSLAPVVLALAREEATIAGLQITVNAKASRKPRKY